MSEHVAPSRGSQEPLRCAEFLQWALPQMGYAWAGFRRVHRQVCKRLRRRVRELGLDDLTAYRRRLDTDPDEWRILDGFCRIPISRFGRDWPVFARLGRDVLPSLAEAASARGAERLEAWSVGCARGEEPYTLNAVWQLMVGPRRPELSLSVLATDTDQAQLERARAGLFGESSLRELPVDWKRLMFEPTEAGFRVRPRFCAGIHFRWHDVREASPCTGFDLILCRNLVLTYFDSNQRRRVLASLRDSLCLGGALVIGVRETLPPDLTGLVTWWPAERIYRREAAGIL